MGNWVGATDIWEATNNFSVIQEDKIDPTGGWNQDRILLLNNGIGKAAGTAGGFAGGYNNTLSSFKLAPLKTSAVFAPVLSRDKALSISQGAFDTAAGTRGLTNGGNTFLGSSSATAGNAVPIVNWVAETPTGRPDANAYGAATTGAQGTLSIRRQVVPQLSYTRLDGTIQSVKFDGLDGLTLVDRKLDVLRTPKAFGQAVKQSAALLDSGLQGIWELPDAEAAIRAQRLLDDAGITNIRVKVVPR